MTGREKVPSTNQDASDGEEGFLSRWSRRKVEAKTDDQGASVDQVDASQSDDAGDVPADPDQREANAIDPATLPDIDSLGPGSDFSVFMQAGVPPSLKTKALRRLWQVKPELANLDGLIDYGEDLTGSFKVVDHLKTAYEVGRGFLKDADDAPAEQHEDGGDDRDESETADAGPREQPEDSQTQAPEEASADDPAISLDDDPKDKA